MKAPLEHCVSESHKSLRLIIFDCDGVLIDSEPISCGIQAAVLTRLGYVTSSQDIMRRFTGVTTPEMYATIEEEWGRRLPEGFEREVKALIETAFREHLKIIPGVGEALSAVALPNCVASSSSVEKLRLGLEIVGLYERFAPNVFSAAQVARGKPAPDLFLFAANNLGVAPSECLVIEDSVAGVKAAKAAEMRVFGFCGGAHCVPGHDSMLIDAGADLVFATMLDLPTLVVDAADRDANSCDPAGQTRAGFR